jgi:hypothetical protein
MKVDSLGVGGSVNSILFYKEIELCRGGENQLVLNTHYNSPRVKINLLTILPYLLKESQ